MTLDEIPDPNRRQQWRLDFGYLADYAAILFMADGNSWDGGTRAKPGKKRQLARLLVNASQYRAR